MSLICQHCFLERLQFQMTTCIHGTNMLFFLKFLVFYIFYQVESYFLHFVLFHFKLFIINYYTISSFSLCDSLSPAPLYDCSQNSTTITKIKKEAWFQQNSFPAQNAKVFPFPLKILLSSSIGLFVLLQFFTGR